MTSPIHVRFGGTAIRHRDDWHSYELSVSRHGEDRASTNSASRASFLPPSASSTVKRGGLSQALSFWSMEIFCCLLGSLAVAAIVFIATRYDGNPQPSFAFAVNLNALVQSLTTVGTTAISAAVFGALSQVSWLIYNNRSRPLLDFDMHQRATQGGIGSLKLLAYSKFSLKHPLQWLAALMAICGFVVSPITQQAISYLEPSMPLENGTASAFRATTFSRSNSMGFIPESSDAFSIEDAVLSAAYLARNTSLGPITPVCSTAQCTWPYYSSIGFCTSVVNVTDSENRKRLENQLAGVIKGNYDMYPNGPPVYPAFLIPWASASNLFNDSVKEAGISQHWIAYSNQLVNLTRTPDVSTFRFVAVAFYFCVKTFNTTVIDGVSDVREVSSTLNITSPPVQPLNFVWNTTFFTNDTCALEFVSKSMTLAGPANLTELYTVNMCTGLLFSDFFNLMTEGAIFQNTDMTVVFVIGQISMALGLSLFGDFLSATIFDPETQFINLENLVGNIAKSLTNFAIKSGSSFYGSSGVFAGVAYQPQTIVVVRWEWLIPVVVYAVLATVFLSVVIFWTYKSGIQPLKNSPLAIMAAPSSELQEILGSFEDVKQAQRIAKGLHVTLDCNSGKFRL